MRILASLALAALATTAAAQSPLLTLTGGTNQGNIGNNIFFNLQVNQTVTINRIDFLCGANTVASSSGILDVYLGPTTYVGNHLNSSLWTLVASATGVTVSPSAIVSGTLGTPLCLGPGNYGVALKSTNFNHGYTNGTGTNVPGSGTNQTFSTAEMTLRAGANQNTPWTSILNEPRVWNGGIYYTLGGTPITVAAWERYGSGCYKWFHSFYEIYGNPSTSFDLKATTGTNSLRLKFVGTGYQVGPFVSGTGTFYTPTGAATNLNLGQNTAASITTPFPVLYPTPNGPLTTNSLEVCDNGYVSPVTGNGAVAVPSTTTFLNGLPRWAAAWFDFDPSLAGQVNFEVDPSNQQFYVTWVGVPDVAAATTSNTMQIMFRTGGDVEFRWKAMSLNIGGTNPCLVGWTPGAAVQDPGITDISAITAAFTTGPTDNPPLALDLTARPKLGSTLTFQTSSIPVNTNIGALLIAAGPQNPPLDLGFIGAPSCFANVDLTTAVSFPFPITGSTASYPIPLANNPTFNGVLVYCQTVTITPGYNSFGGLTSNGVRVLCGSL